MKRRLFLKKSSQAALTVSLLGLVSATADTNGSTSAFTGNCNGANGPTQKTCSWSTSSQTWTCSASNDARQTCTATCKQQNSGAGQGIYGCDNAWT